MMSISLTFHHFIILAWKALLFAFGQNIFATFQIATFCLITNVGQFYVVIEKVLTFQSSSWCKKWVNKSKYHNIFIIHGVFLKIVYILQKIHVYTNKWGNVWKEGLPQAKSRWGIIHSFHHRIIDDDNKHTTPLEWVIWSSSEELNQFL